ncbi:MAG: DMT family transporter [Bacteriovoracaceae bacterium]|nr:DMT family transporter [Bacteriovoracaceae bacterium]
MKITDGKNAAIWALVFVQILFGVNFAASKHILNEFNPIFWAHVRFIASFLILFLIVLSIRRKHPPLTKGFILPLIPFSLLAFHVGQSLFLKGLKLTTATNAAVISSLIPILTLIIVILRRQEHFTRYRLIGFASAVIGVVILRRIENFSLESMTLQGDFYILVASLCYAVFIAYSKKFMESFDSLWITVWLLGISSVTLIPFTIEQWILVEFPVLDVLMISCMIFSVVGATVVTYFLNNWALARTESGNVALLIYLQPVVACYFAWQFLNESITSRIVFATLLILGGQVVSVIHAKSKHFHKRNTD